MSTNLIDKEIMSVWEKLATDNYKSATRIEVLKRLEEVAVENHDDASRYLSTYLSILNETLHFLLQLEKIVSEIRDLYGYDEKTPSFCFAMVLARVISLTVAIRKLILLGLEDPARVVARSLVESLDLAIVTAGDNEFANSFFGDHGHNDGKTFWEKNIGYGNIYKKIKPILKSIGIPDTEIENTLSHLRNAKNILSSSVHSSVETTFRCMFVPSLGNPGLCAQSSLGHISSHSPGLCSFVIMEVYRFSCIIIKLVTSLPPPPLFTRASSASSIESLLVSYLTLQGVIDLHEDSLQTDHRDHWHEGEKG